MGLAFQAKAMSGDSGSVPADSFLRKARVVEFALKSRYPQARKLAAARLDRLCPWHGLRSPVFRAYVISSADDAKRLAKFLQSQVQVPVGFDFETEGWAPAKKLVGLTGVKHKTNHISPCHPKHKATPVCFQINWGTPDVYVVDGKLLYLFAQWLVDRGAPKDFANVTFEQSVCHNLGVTIAGVHRDCIAQDFLLDETIRQGRHNLKAQAEDYLGLDVTDFLDVFPDGDFAGEFRKGNLAALEYAAKDPFLTTLLCWLHEEALSERQAYGEYTRRDLYERYERPFQATLTRMQLQPLPVHYGNLYKRAEELDQQADELAATIYEKVGKPINLGSPAQLAEYYYGTLNMPVKSTNASQLCLICGKTITKRHDHQCPEHGQLGLVNRPAVDKGVLKDFEEQGEEVAAALKKWRALKKEKGTWVDGFFRMADGEKELHPVLRGTHVVSGRLSGGVWLTTPKSSKQIIGFEDEAAEKCIISADYSQLELRVLAHLSGDENMIAAYENGRDLHSNTAAVLRVLRQYGAQAVSDAALVEAEYELIYAAAQKAEAIEEKKIDAVLTAGDKALIEGRRKAKAVIFGRNYGMGPSKFAREQNTTIEEAELVFAALTSAYPRVDEFYVTSIESCYKTLELHTILGRNKKLYELASDDSGVRAQGERLVKNVHCQGGAADILRGAMIQLDVDSEAGGLYGTTGGEYGSWSDEVWRPDPKRLPMEWFTQGFPPALAQNIGQLGRWRFRQALQIHDDIKMVGPKKFAKEALARLVAIMEDPFGPAITLRVPLAASGKISSTL